MENALAAETMLLRPFTASDAPAYHALYSELDRLNLYEGTAIFPGELPEAFAARIAGYCAGLWTIRLLEAPETIIGDAALHHWNPAAAEIEIGGALLPAYWGKGIMRQAFALLFNVAKEQFAATTILGTTTPGNKRALRMAEKLGFVVTQSDETTIMLRRKEGI